MPRLYFSRVSQSWVAELTFSFDSDSFFDSASYFVILLGFDSVSYVHRNRIKQFGFLVFFTFFDWVAYDRIFFLKVPFRVPLTLMVIYRALKDKRRVLVLRKGYNIWVGREISWKGIWADKGFCGRQGQCRGLGQKINGEHGEHRWNNLTFTLPLFLCGQRVLFHPFSLEAHHIKTLLPPVASCLPYDDSRKWPNTESMPLTSLYIPSQDNEEPHPSIWLVS